MTKFVVIGSGVVGLYTAYKLLDKNVPASDIVIIAEYEPGDESLTFTSPYAGADFSCITSDDDQSLVFDKHTYLQLKRIQKDIGGASYGLDRYTSVEYFQEMPTQKKIASWRSYLEEYIEVSKDHLPEGVAFAIQFKAWNFNAPKFIMSLSNYLKSQGIQVQKKKLSHVSEAFATDTKFVFNCTGLGAKTLGGVEDNNVYPTRGQVLVVKAPHVKQNTHLWGKDFATYIIKRPYSNDQTILGGFMQKNNWTGSTFKTENEDILKRTTELFPELLQKNPRGPSIEDLEIVRSVAGLRPSRHGNVRIEKEQLSANKYVIHNYGAGGYGFQAGVGMAEAATDLAFPVVSKL